jgi:hypothetical protein
VTTRHAMIRNAVLAVSCASVLAACSSRSAPEPAAVTSMATAMPVAAAAPGSYTGRSASSNLAPDPDTLRRWTRGGFVVRSGGPGGATDFEMVGSGEPQGSNDAFSPPIKVLPGQSYVFSLWIDPSHISSGSAVLGIYAPSRMVSYGQVRVNPGPPGRYAVDAIIPKGQRTVRIDFQPNDETIARGQILRISQPMLVRGALPAATVASTPAPKSAKVPAAPVSASP